jgi:uncharacterized membrane protein
MEFEDHYVTRSLKHTMEHWLWCAVLLIEVFGLFWCLKFNFDCLPACIRVSILALFSILTFSLLVRYVIFELLILSLRRLWLHCG